jgi:hypothetical protein
MMKVNFAFFILLLLLASTWAGPVAAEEPSLSKVVFYVA